MSIQEYISDRIDDQIEYFDNNAIQNQKRYKRLKSTAIVCNVLTTFIIAIIFVVPEAFKTYVGVAALFTSAIVLFTYQWEEFQSNGAKWEKFRLVAEQLRSEKQLFILSSGRYSGLEPELSKNLLVETTEGVIRGTDISYFALLVEPGKRIEKRMADFK